MAKFKIGHTVFIKCDEDKRPFIVTGILIRRRYREYEVTGIDSMFYKQEFEICSEVKKQRSVTGFKNQQ